MTDNRKHDSSIFAETPNRAAYEVGYAKPPKDTRFKPGQSGNPRGRPKGAKNKRPALNEERMKNLILDEAYRSIKVRDGVRQVTIPVAQAVIRSIAVNAAKNRIGAQRLFSELLATAETSNKALHDAYLETAIEYKTEWEKELRLRKERGIDGPLPIPHPDDVVIDVRAGQVHIKGPMTPEEKAELDELVADRKEIERELARVKRRRNRTKSATERAELTGEIEKIETCLAYLDRFEGWSAPTEWSTLNVSA
ncbi:MAG: DUF5681 domain-containing protein [Paracoccaceae bacterium]|nr:DUF5681 domain-containing protein [Paracoccaceae bacterium]